MNDKIKNLSHGSISKGLFHLAMPLISASFVQMAYSMTDMIWLGRLGSEAVAAVGAAGFFLWLCNGIAFTSKTGAEVSISQSIGGHYKKNARRYAQQALNLATLLGIFFTILIFTLAPFLMHLFRFATAIEITATHYLRIVSPCAFLSISINTFSGIYNGQGNSKIPFKLLSCGLIANIFLDPFFIFGYGLIPAMGAAGAAIATLVAQTLVFFLFAYRMLIRKCALGTLRLISKIHKDYFMHVARLGLPVSLQSVVFSMFSLTLATMAASWGHVGVAVQSIGGQIEAIQWMTAGGFATALAAFTGQNWGAGNLKRIGQGYRYTLRLGCGIALAASVLFYFFSRQIFSVFVHDAQTIEAGGQYLRILALSQLFSALEMVTAGAFNGCGRTSIPAYTGIVLNACRIPLAFALTPYWGMNGIWWSITISSILKGIVLAIWFHFFYKKLQHKYTII